MAEAVAPADELAQHEGCPSLGEDLGGLGDGAELAVPLHLVQGTDGSGPRQVHFLGFQPPAGRCQPDRDTGGAPWPSEQGPRPRRATTPHSTMWPSPTCHGVSGGSWSVPAMPATRRNGASGTARSTAVRPSSRAVPAPPMSGPPSDSRASASTWSRCAEGATTSRARPSATAGSSSISLR